MATCSLSTYLTCERYVALGVPSEAQVAMAPGITPSRLSRIESTVCFISEDLAHPQRPGQNRNILGAARCCHDGEVLDSQEGNILLAKGEG